MVIIKSHSVQINMIPGRSWFQRKPFRGSSLKQELPQKGFSLWTKKRSIKTHIWYIVFSSPRLSKSIMIWRKTLPWELFEARTATERFFTMDKVQQNYLNANIWSCNIDYQVSQCPNQYWSQEDLEWNPSVGALCNQELLQKGSSLWTEYDKTIKTHNWSNAFSSPTVSKSILIDME